MKEPKIKFIREYDVNGNFIIEKKVNYNLNKIAKKMGYKNWDELYKAHTSTNYYLAFKDIDKTFKLVKNK